MSRRSIWIVAGIAFLSLVGFVPAKELRFASQSPDQAALYYKVDTRGQSCGRCHTPDGIEFRIYRFNPSDVVRRARQHLSPTEADSLALSLTSGVMPDAMNPTVAAPYQPGGLVLPGESALDRDEALGRELIDRMPLLMGAPIADADEAKKVREEVLALDPRRLRVGIKTSMLSEDIFHGKDHASLAAWLPDVPVPDSPAFDAARSAFQRDPSDANLAALFEALRGIRGRSTFEQMSVFKYASLMLWQQSIRDHGFDGVYQMKPPGRWNPIWLVAEAARVNAMGDPLQLGIPPEVLVKKSGGPKLAEQMRALTLPWMWMGWTIDPSLVHSEGTKHGTVRGDYFIRALEDYGPYPIHTALFLTKKVVELGCRPENWPYTERQHFELQYSFFLIDGGLIHREPASATQRSLFRRLTWNSFRLSLYLVLDDVAKTGACVRPESQLNQIKYIKDYWTAAGAPKRDLDLCDAAATALRGAKVDAR